MDNPEKLMPAVFIGHGSPMNAIQSNDFTWALAALPRNMERPKAVICVSAHWVSNGTLVTGAAHPGQIYDFGGFPQELYNVRYRPRGSVALAKRVADLLADVPAQLNSDWGIDHGAWSVLRHMYPKGDVPVIQLSLDAAKTEREHYETAKKMFSLRAENVLIIGSGNIVHNLYELDPEQYGARPFGWAAEFDASVKGWLDNSQDENLIRYEETGGKAAAIAVPTNEHYLPLLYIAALRRPGDKLRYIYEGFQHGSLSMRSFVIE